MAPDIIICTTCGALQLDSESEICEHCEEKLKQTRDVASIVFPDSVKKVLSSGSVGDNIFFIEDFATFSPIKWKGKAADDFVNIREFRFWNRAKNKPLNSGFAVTFEELIVFRALASKGLEQDKIVKFLRSSCRSLLFIFGSSC